MGNDTDYIMIDYTIFYSYNFSILYNDIDNNIEKLLKLYDKEDDYSKGVIFIVQKECASIFNSLKKDEKILYLNSNNFLENIWAYTFTLYDDKKYIAEIYDVYMVRNGYKNKYKYIYRNISNALIKYVSDNCRIYLVLDMLSNEHSIASKNDKKYLEILSGLGFNGTYIAKKSPLGINLNKSTLFLYRINTLKISHKVLNNNLINNKILINKIEFINQFKINQKCKLKFTISGRTKYFLEKLTKNWNNIKKEISGGFYIKNTYKFKGQLVFEFDIDEKLVKINKNEEADITPSRFNFHTHPFQAYINNNVNYAWPSSADYGAFLYSAVNYGTIFHILGSVEGIYVISISKDSVKDNIKNILKDIPKLYFKKYNLNDKRKITSPEKSFTPHSYISHINSSNFEYKNKKLFNVQFSAWNDNHIFEVYFPMQNKTCFL